MTKQLREWTAPDGRDVVYRYNPKTDQLEHKHANVTTGWVEFSAMDYVNAPAWLQDGLRKLVADPYVPEPKGLREQIADAIETNLSYTNGWRVGEQTYRADCEGVASVILALIDRERPALGEVDAEVLRAELVRRGWEWKEICYVGRGVRRVLIAPERAGTTATCVHQWYSDTGGTHCAKCGALNPYPAPERAG